MATKDIRWIQRFNNFEKAFAQLKEAVELAGQRKLSKLEEQGLIQDFEYTHELAWNTLKDFLEDRGVKNIFGSKDTTREAFKTGLIENGESWMEMIDSRNQTTHTYNQETVTKIVSAVTHIYFAEFEALKTRLETFKKEQE